MPRTLLLALIATAMTNRSQSTTLNDTAKHRDNIRKLPAHDRSSEARTEEQVTATNATTTH
ncbi:MAG: hypothetical protein JWM03_620 [Rhodocyclales bacterium]|nr:hypothetical protein [Rhodocyclales bacterium]